jgi:hypothetical protein
VWDAIEPNIQLIRDYRNDVAFHVNKDLRRYFETRRRFQERLEEIIGAMRAFWDLSAELVRQQEVALPDFRNEIDPLLKKALPELTPEQIEAIKDFFIQNSLAKPSRSEVTPEATPPSERTR